MSSLDEIDSLEILVIVDNEVDPISSYQHPDLKVSGLLPDVALRAPLPEGSRGGSKFEIRLDNVCCGAHGLSLMIVRTIVQKAAVADIASDSHQSRKASYGLVRYCSGRPDMGTQRETSASQARLHRVDTTVSLAS